MVCMGINPGTDGLSNTPGVGLGYIVVTQWLSWLSLLLDEFDLMLSSKMNSQSLLFRNRKHNNSENAEVSLRQIFRS